MRRAATLGLLLLSATAGAETRRLAIVVGNNAGTTELAPLRFAENDAGKVARVLVELGDVRPDDVLLLQGRATVEVEAAIAQTRDRVARLKASPDVRTVVVFYFSGHSDGEAIELGPEKLAYARLKAMLAGTGADLRLVIVDACRSGGGVREKGGTAAAPFAIRLADTLQATGEAFISSSAANEAALESSEVMGSFFTHNLVSGLRGAADSSGDKQVTLAEAYQYAYDRTVSATAMSPVGAQHPNYDFRLSGQGELVLTTLLKPSAVLVLPQADRAIITDLSRDQVIAEVPRGLAREIALPAGQYGLRLFSGGQAFGGRVVLADGARRVVVLDELRSVSSGALVATKGAVVQAHAPDNAFGLSLGFGATGRVLLEPGLHGGPKYQLRVGVEPVTSWLAALGPVRLLGQLRVLALGEMSFDAPPVGGGEAANEAGAQLRVGYQLSLEVWRLTLSVGVELGPGFLAQLYEARTAALVVTGAPRVMLRVRLGGPVSVFAEGDVAFLGVPITNAGWQWFAFASANAGVLLTL